MEVFSIEAVPLHVAVFAGKHFVVMRLTVPC